jgi:hypothetical protein
VESLGLKPCAIKKGGQTTAFFASFLFRGKMAAEKPIPPLSRVVEWA